MPTVGELEWDVRVEDGTAVVELPRRLALDERGADRLDGAIERAVSRGGVDRVAMLVDVEHPLGDALHDAVVRGARAAAASGVTEWRVVAEYERKATAVARALPAVDAAVVVDDRSVRAQPA